jgi:ribose transport system substrate-binding protein
MKQKKVIVILLSVLMVGTLLIGCNKSEDKVTKESSTVSEEPKMQLAWYASTAHPYFDEVQQGVKDFAKNEGVEVTQQIGPDWTQASENEGVEALVAKGITGLSIYPSDASGANGLYEEITEHGVNVINFGTDTMHPTTAKFAVTSDAKETAIQATESLVKIMGEKGNILNVLEVLEDPNTAMRKEGVEEVVAKYPDVKIIQQIAGIKTQEDAVSKVTTALSANSGKIDGIICTGMISSVGLTQVLSDYYSRQPNAKHIKVMCLETTTDIIDAINNGNVDATLAKNNYGHGYISMKLLQLLDEGYTPIEGQYKVNLPSIVVTKDNLDSYNNDMLKSTQDVLGELTTKYVKK